MSTSAQAIFAHAPLGALISWSDKSPRPPARHVRKVREWERRNGQGRLVGRDPSSALYRHATFTLHEGDFGSNGTIVLSVRRMFGTDSSFAFEIVSVPQSGEALVVTQFAGRDELHHVAPSREAAERWLAGHGYRDARIDVVPPASIAA